MGEWVGGTKKIKPVDVKCMQKGAIVRNFLLLVGNLES